MLVCLLFFAACASFPGKELPVFAFAQIPVREKKPSIHVDARFLSYGRESAGASRFFRKEADRILKESKVFSNISTARAKLRVSLQLAVTGDNFFFSLASIVSGLSLTLIPVYSTEVYTLSVEVKEGEKTLKKYEYKERVKTWIQLFLVFLAPGHRPEKTAIQVMDSMLINFLHDFQRDEIQAEKPASAFTDTVVLQDGTRFENVKTAVTPDFIIIVTTDGKTLVFKRDEILSIMKK